MWYKNLDRVYTYPQDVRSRQEYDEITYISDIASDLISGLDPEDRKPKSIK